MKHATGLARSAQEWLNTEREKQPDGGAVKHLTRRQPRGGASWSSPHSLTFRAEIVHAATQAIRWTSEDMSLGEMHTTQRNSLLRAMDTSIQVQRTHTHVHY